MIRRAARDRCRKGGVDRPLEDGGSAVIGFEALRGDPGRLRCLAVLSASATLMAVMALPLVWGLVYHEDDLGGLHLPLRHFFADCLARGNDPAWHPGMFCGFYLQGEGQAGLDHPIHRLLYGALSLGAAFNLELLLSYPLLFVGTALMLRLRGLPPDASLFGGLVFAFSGFNLVHYFHINMIAVVAHIPWLLAAIDLAWRAEGPGRASMAWASVAALTASQLWIGHPQLVWLSGLSELLYAAWLWRRMARPRVGPWAGLAVAKAIGLLAAASQVLPTLDIFSGSIRNDPSTRFAAINPLHPANLVQLVAPYAFRARAFDGLEHDGNWPWHEFGLYNTAVVTVLVVWALSRTREAPRPGLTRWAAGLGAVGLVLAFGRYTPVGALCERLPIVGLFRCPSRAIVLVHLASALLASNAFDDLARLRGRRDRLPWHRLGPIALPLALSLIAAAGFATVRTFWDASPLGSLVGSWEAIRTGPLLMAGASLAVLFAARGVRGVLVGLVLLTAADQATYGIEGMLRRIPPLPIASVVDLDPPPPPEAARTKGGTNLLMMRGLSQFDGYGSLRPRRVLDGNRTAALRIAGVGHVRDQSVPGAWRMVPEPLPIARLVTRAVVSRDPNGDLETIDPEATALVDRPLSLSVGVPGRARIDHRGTTEIDLSVEADSRQLLVLAESHHPGWRAEVDGRAAEVLPAYGDLMACVVEPGSHRVRFRFAPMSLRVGRLGSVVGIALILGWPVAGFVVGRVQRRSDDQQRSLRSRKSPSIHSRSPRGKVGAGGSRE